MTVLAITGASGFLGRTVLDLALANLRLDHVIATDRVSTGISHPRLSEIVGDLSDPAISGAASDADIVVHLAATLGAAAEADPLAARHVNLDATLDLMAACRPGTRFVYASSLAVLGATSSERAPTMVYGAQKAMAEIAIETATRRGEIDGISLRPGGIVARRGLDAALRSAFLSQVFWAVHDGKDITLPVSPKAATWLCSAINVATNFMHAALAQRLGPVRSLTLPMLRCEFAELVTGLHKAFPDSASQVDFAPDADIMRIFGQAQHLDFSDSLAAGFKPDNGLDSLIHDAMSQGSRT
ncbi:MAG: NAD-dependent epimerase/dehydratase family protein [Rhodobacteraceae bacterium]|nr:NAD-dependent epimerase/dehydratase family protein [Paracoccaceae bacterium]